MSRAAVTPMSVRHGDRGRAFIVWICQSPGVERGPGVYSEEQPSIRSEFRMTRRRALIFAVPVILLGGAVQAFAKPNFTGDWKLNADKSNFGPIPPPTAMTLNIDHSDPNLKILTKQSGAQGDMEYEAKYTTDGKESV